MVAKIRIRGGTFTQWQNTNPILEEREISYITGGTNAGKFKVGDGVAHWNDLPFNAARFPEDVLALADQNASSSLPSSGQVQQLFQAIRNYLKYETQARLSADTGLQNNLNSEANTRREEDEDIRNLFYFYRDAINAEMEELRQADTELRQADVSLSEADAAINTEIEELWEAIESLDGGGNSGTDNSAIFEALALKADKNNPTFTGIVKVPSKTTTPVNNGTLVATEAQLYALRGLSVWPTSSVIATTGQSTVTIPTITNRAPQVGDFVQSQYGSIGKIIQVISNTSVKVEVIMLWGREPKRIGVEFTNPGNYNWIVPAGVNAIAVTACGAGGKGGTGNSTRAGGGGGGGACILRQNYDVTAGDVISLTVGNNNAANGGSTVIGNLVTLAGGTSGVTATSSGSGAGGAAGSGAGAGGAGGAGAAVGIGGSTSTMSGSTGASNGATASSGGGSGGAGGTTSAGIKTIVSNNANGGNGFSGASSSIYGNFNIGGNGGSGILGGGGGGGGGRGENSNAGAGGGGGGASLGGGGGGGGGGGNNTNTSGGNATTDVGQGGLGGTGYICIEWWV